METKANYESKVNSRKIFNAFMNVTKNPHSYSLFPSRSQRILPLEEMELVKDNVFHGSIESFNIYVN